MSALMMILFAALLLLSFPVGYALTLGASISLFVNLNASIPSIILIVSRPDTSLPNTV